MNIEELLLLVIPESAPHKTHQPTHPEPGRPDFARLASEMTPLDFEVGHLCQQTFDHAMVRGGGRERGLYFGMMEVLRAGLLLSCTNQEKGISLLGGKARQSEDSLELVGNMAAIGSKFADPSTWSTLCERSRNGCVPVIVTFTSNLVDVARRHTHPPTEDTFRGFYSYLATSSFIAGIGFGITHPDLAQALVHECA
jgi:hypothetical protein